MVALRVGFQLATGAPFPHLAVAPVDIFAVEHERVFPVCIAPTSGERGDQEQGCDHAYSEWYAE